MGAATDTSTGDADTIMGGTVDADTITDGTGDAGTITGGTGAAAITSIAITDKPSLNSLIVIPLPGRSGELQRRERVAPTRRGRFSVSCRAIDSAGAQPSPISTAIRIRSE